MTKHDTKTFAEIGVQASLDSGVGKCYEMKPPGSQSSSKGNNNWPQASSVNTTPVSQHRNETRFNFVDLGYDSLHSTPKQTFANDSHPPLIKQNSVNSSSQLDVIDRISRGHPVHDHDGDDMDEEGSVTTNATNHMATVRHCQFRRYMFKWVPFVSKQSSNQSIPLSSPPSSNDTEPMARCVVNKNPLVDAHNGDDHHDDRQQQQLQPQYSPENVEREEWGKKIDFLLSIIGFAVDLSNVWRFPYLCYKNGGGVFLIPYTTMLLFGALPLFFMELSLGQFAKSGPISLWDKICPPLKGIGYCFVLISWYVSFYYNVIIAWTFYFVIKTLTSGDLMPWQHCNNWYNTHDCISIEEIKQLPCRSNQTLATDPGSICSKLFNRTSPTEEFFNLDLLQIDQSRGLSSLGTIRPELVGCLIIVFIVLYFSLFKGVKSSGKVVWFTATAPYFILTILLIRGLFLPGAISGILYYINPRLEKLLEPMVWVDAAVQVFYSIGVGFGVHLTYASFNKFHNNCYRDCLVTVSVNSLTSFYSGFVIFTYLGYMAESMGKEIQNVASEGYGLVFQVYPEAISTLPFAKFWSLLFFLMLLTLGIDSAMGGLEAVITGVMDEFNLKWMKREYFTIIVISSSFIGALINCTQGGAFTMVWFDTYSAGISLLLSAMFEALAVTYFYGIDRFCLNIETMIGHPPSRYFVLSWKYISPIFLTTITIMSIINSESIVYYGYNFPMWASVIGWMFTLSSISAIPVYALFWYAQKHYNFNWPNHIEKSSVRNRSPKPQTDDGTTKAQRDILLAPQTTSLNNAVYV